MKVHIIIVECNDSINVSGEVAYSLIARQWILKACIIVSYLISACDDIQS